MHIGGGSDGDLAVAMTAQGTGRGSFEPPKDRGQLANMRVIRRNLVYVVGLAPSISTAETLRKPEYFGQYGKIAKIVINRNHPGNSDPRRATASAYITFAHPDDTLACILAVDGFYHEGRNVRASYGTSKYCSAFIRNVRCNNPDCTYLHCMGDGEDTFSKQEIQAGYVTSGRDVLARQQQLTKNTGARRRVGGGGPSGTGRVPATPIFPAPTYDEPPKPPTAAIVNAPGAFPQIGNPSFNRSQSVSVTGFSSVAAGTMSPSAAKVAARKTSVPSRSVSMSAAMSSGPATAVVTGLPTAGSKGGKKKAQKASANGPSHASAKATAPKPATAASVVAGLRSTKTNTAPPPAHATLTSLTPLNKKGGGTKSAASSTGGGKSVNTASSGHSVKGHSRNNSVPDSVTLPSNLPVSATTSQKQQEVTSKLPAVQAGDEIAAAAVGSIPASTSAIGANGGLARGPGTIGGSVIGAVKPVDPPVSSPIGPAAVRGSAVGGLGAIGGGPSISGGTMPLSPGIGMVGGRLMPVGGNSVVGAPSRSNDAMGGAVLPPVGGGRIVGPSGNGGLAGNTIIGGSMGGSGNLFASSSGHGGSGSSALASMLGIQLPTGSGSLRERSSLFDSPAGAIGSNVDAGIGGMAPGPIIGGPSMAPGGLLVGGGDRVSSTGGVAIGGFQGNGTGSSSAVGNNPNDIALLQTLLPGVRITAGENSQQPTAGSIGGAVVGGGDWGSAVGGTPQHQQQQQRGIGFAQAPVAVGGLAGGRQQEHQEEYQQKGFGGGDNWGAAGLYGAGPPIGASVGTTQRQQQEQQQQRPSNIW